MHGKDFMERNWNKNLDLETISKEAGMSKYHFARLFRDVFGLSPYQFFIALKMKNAHRILSEGKSIQSIAELLGYPDVSSFSKAFSKFYGLPPSLHQKIA
jgi:AraC-like DNA-binding protein